MECEKVNPYADDRRKSLQVRDMFNNIAPAYDFMNRAMTFGIDRLWRRKAVRMVAALHPASILDIATGTADMALLLARRTNAHIRGVDLSEGMIEIGCRKVADAGLTDRIELSVADCLALPFPDDSFDAITVAYGVRNFENLLAGYREMLRVLRPGASAVIIELSTPQSPVTRPLYNLYTRHIIPAVGRLISRDVRAYSYLPESIAAVAQGPDMLRVMEEAGFTDTRFHSLTFGVCTIYIGVKPSSPLYE